MSFTKLQTTSRPAAANFVDSIVTDVKGVFKSQAGNSVIAITTPVGEATFTLTADPALEYEDGTNRRQVQLAQLYRMLEGESETGEITPGIVKAKLPGTKICVRETEGGLVFRPLPESLEDDAVL